jgi:mannitol/fructose-specific phosphotransferase system IIA component (Ntr-type)
LVALAETTGHLYDPKALLASLEAREELCSTAMPGGFALPHPRFHDPYLFETSLLVVGRPVQEIHFGAPDGEPTRLFFLICCQDDRLHLHTLARFCLIAQKTNVINQLLAAPDAPTIRASLIAAEQELLADHNPGS